MTRPLDVLPVGTGGYGGNSVSASHDDCAPCQYEAFHPSASRPDRQAMIAVVTAESHLADAVENDDAIRRTAGAGIAAEPELPA